MLSLPPTPLFALSGEHDWMDVKAARRVTASMAEQREQAFKADLKVMVTPDAGHYPAIDQPGGLLLLAGAVLGLQGWHPSLENGAAAVSKIQQLIHVPSLLPPS